MEQGNLQKKNYGEFAFLMMRSMGMASVVGKLRDRL